MDKLLLPVAKHRYDATKEPERWGYVDRAGKMVIDYRFDHAGDFRDGVARVVIAGQAAFIDETGEPLFEHAFNSMASLSEDRAVVYLDKKAGYIDRTGKLIVDTRYDGARPFSQGLAAVREGAHWSYIDLMGDAAFPQKFDDADSFSQGFAAVRVGDKWTYVDKSGNLVCEPFFEAANSFSEDLVAVKFDGKYGYVDKEFNIRVEPQFDLAQEFHDGLACVMTERHKWTLAGDWHFIDKEGKTPFARTFYGALGTRFSEGLAAVPLGSKRYAYCDATGELKIEWAKFYGSDRKSALERPLSFAGNFRSGLAQVELQPSFHRMARDFKPDYMGYIDTSGEVIYGALV